MSSGLRGKRVLVTRAKGQNAAMMAQLADLGAIPVEFPTLTFTLPDDLRPLDEAIAALNGYDWLIFTSTNGVDFFLTRLQQREGSIETLKAHRIAAIGPATWREIVSFGVKAASITVGRLGADPPWAFEMDEPATA